MVFHSEVFFPTNTQELFAVWNHFEDAVISAGGIEYIRNQYGRTPMLPRKIISLDKMEELRKISRSERYIEIGCMVKLNQIINMGKIIPEVLTLCLRGIAGPQIRSLATIGGNICNPDRKLDASAPMIALDAQYELRTAQSARWVSASRFSSTPGPPILAPRELLTRIRIPLEPWTYNWYRKFKVSGSNMPGGNILFILRNQKDILSDIRVVCSGQTILRDKNSESMMMGKRLPLDRKTVMAFLDSWKTYLSTPEGDEESAFREDLSVPGEDDNFRPELIKTQIFHFIESTLTFISD